MPAIQTKPATLTAHERITRCLERRDIDRCPVYDYPWAPTEARWRREGMPAGVDHVDFFGLDRIAGIHANNGPRWPTETIEDTPEYTIVRSDWGAVLKNWRQHGGVPEFLDFRIRDAASWAEAKARMTPTADRIDWEGLKKNHPRWVAQGAWIEANLWFGFDVTHSWMVGTERVLGLLAEGSDWLVDMWNTQLDMCLALHQQVWDAGYRFDAIRWPDDMGFKGKQFFSRRTYQRLLKPVHKRAADWAHAKGIRVAMHSCGDIRPFIPDLIEIGIDLLNPLEVKAGIDPAVLKRDYGSKLAFHGGLNAALFDNMDAMEAEMAQIIPVLKQGGGYIVASDHSVPDSVSVEDFRRFVAAAKRLGAY